MIGSDRYRSVPATGSVADEMLQRLDGLGVNYDTAHSVDALHAKYPNKFFFESETSSETSTRGYYQDPNLLNTGQNYTPGRMELSSYDNNMDSWTMSGEYGLKKDRDRQFFAGEFLWSGCDYIGEPTPYTVFPVKTSFFGAVDTAGFPKDAYYLLQVAVEPGADGAPAADELDRLQAGPAGRGLGVRQRADRGAVPQRRLARRRSRSTHKTTTDGLQLPRDHRVHGRRQDLTRGACPGSYTSPNGSSGKLHLALERAVRARQARCRRQGRHAARSSRATRSIPPARPTPSS